MLCLVAVSRVPLPQIACGSGWRKLRPRVALSVGLAWRFASASGGENFGPDNPETAKRLVFLTNKFLLPAATIAALYKKRWSVELFFKWIKQNLRIKHFYGTSENAVKTQIWIAVCVYVLAAIIKKELALEASLYTFLQILSVHSFEKTQLSCAFQDLADNNSSLPPANQLNSFDI